MKTKLNILIALCLIFSNIYSYSQTNIFNMKVDLEPEKPKFGINHAYFNHFYLGLHFNTNLNNNNAENYSLRSPKFYLGWKNIVKINNFLAINADIEIANNRLCVKQDNNKTIPDTLIWDKQRLIQQQLSSSFHFRINFNKRRGSYMGHYIDLGFRGTWNFTNSHFTKSKYNDDTIAKLWRRNPAFFETFNYGPSIKLGIKRYVFSAHYNLLGTIDNNYFTNDFTTLSLGIEIGLHK